MRKLFPALLFTLCLSSCAGSAGFQQIGSSILSASSGMFGGASSGGGGLFEAGGRLARAATPISEEEEYYLGRSVAATILGRYQPVKRPALQGYVQKVGLTVASFSNRPEIYGGYHFTVIDTPEINAVSAPGGFVFLSSGFLKIIPNEDAMAAVFAHEIGHIALGHGVKAISNSNLTQALTLIGQEVANDQLSGVGSEIAGVFGDSVRDVTNTLLENGYSRSQEYDADRYAAELLKQVGYDQGAIITMLSAIEQHGKSSDPSGGWFNTHPKAKNRISELDDIVTPSASSTQSSGSKVRLARFKSATKGIS